MDLIPSPGSNNINIYKPQEIEIKLTKDNKCIIQSKQENQNDQQNLSNDNLINFSLSKTSICETVNGKIPINTNDNLLISFSNISELTKTNNFSIIDTSSVDKDNNVACNYDTENNNTNPSKIININEINKNNDIYKNYIFNILNSDKKSTSSDNSKSKCNKKNPMKKNNFKVEKLETVDITKNKTSNDYFINNIKIFNIDNIENLHIASRNNQNDNIKLSKEKIKHLSSFSFGLNNFNIVPSSNSSSVKSNNINNLNTYVTPKNNINDNDVNKYFQVNNNEEDNLYFSPKFNEEVINQSDKQKEKENERVNNNIIKEIKKPNIRKNEVNKKLKIDKDSNNFSIINPINNNFDNKNSKNNYNITRNNIFSNSSKQQKTKNSQRKIQNINLIMKNSSKKLQSVGRTNCESERTKNNDNINIPFNHVIPQTKLSKYIDNTKSKKLLKNKLKSESNSNTDTIVHIKIKNNAKIVNQKLLRIKISSNCSNYSSSMCKTNKIKITRPNNNENNKLLSYSGSSKCCKKILHVNKNNSFNKITHPKLKITSITTQNKENIKTKGNIDQSLKERLQNILKKNINKMKNNREIVLVKEDSSKTKNNTNSTNNNTNNSNSSSNCNNNSGAKSNSVKRSNSRKLKIIEKNPNSQRSEKNINKKINSGYIFTHNTFKTSNMKPRIDSYINCKNNSNANLNLKNSKKKKLDADSNLYKNNTNPVNKIKKNKINNISIEVGEYENIPKNNNNKNYTNKNLNNMKSTNIYKQNEFKDVSYKSLTKNNFNENNSYINSSNINGYKKPKAFIQNFSNYKRKNELNGTEINVSKNVNEEKNTSNFLENIDVCSHGNQNVANKTFLNLGEKYHTNEY